MEEKGISQVYAEEKGTVLQWRLTVSARLELRLLERRKGTQAYEARRPSVFARLGALQGDSGVSSSRGAATWSPEGGIWPCYFAAAYWCCDLRMLGEDNRPIGRCPMLKQHKCL